jgi:hypothetical protein
MTDKCFALVVHKSDASDLSEPSNQGGAKPLRGFGSARGGSVKLPEQFGAILARSAKTPTALSRSDVLFAGQKASDIERCVARC